MSESPDQVSRLQAVVPGIRPLSVSAPFGNYIRPSGCTATLGTFTVEDRPGRVWRILKTVRYYPRARAWINKIGLRNPGIGWVEKKVATGKLDLSDKLVSIHGFNDGEWFDLIERLSAMKPMGMELNMSCPNVGHIDWPEDLFTRAVATGVPVIVKLPPVNYEAMAQMAYDQGVRVFHCCNTLPVPAGGMSGYPLKPVALQCIRAIRDLPWGQDVAIIGGGGIRSAAELDEYQAAGADAYAIGTIVMSPILLVSHARVVPIRERADALVAG
ncbi:hypothetical protein [Algisphaera agarilytica]|uniref:Dihydroorotate dehydrogenase n=1 Tax=Algisphaera agarilytica TaxID=1385975 RepID=A0A7X0H373_9BACT|nr:hypothetical protein [Algisphaera agarilytica]MBB6428359.1 dihydroorotate dehydrogenase [Algisphaera agarilytica]